MKTLMVGITFLVCTLHLGSVPVWGQFDLGGRLALFTDVTYSDTTIADATPGALTVYVVHLGIPSAAACQFSVKAHGGFTGVWLGETSPFPVTLGDSPNGIGVDYGGCKMTPILVLVITYQLFGTSTPCSYLAAEPHPDSVTGMIDVVTCTDPAYASGGTIVTGCPLATTSITWGGIKSLYR